MMKVLHIISDTNIGGAGRVLANYLRLADKSTFDIHVALPKGSLLAPVLEPLGCTIHFVDGMADRSYHKDDVTLLKTLLDSVKPDVVHTHGAFSGRVASKKKGIPVVFTRHTVFPVSWKKRTPPMKWVNGWLNCHYADAMIAVSPAAAENLVEMGVPAHRITTIFNGVAPLTLRSEEENKALKANLGIPTDRFVFGILARLEHYKGHRLIFSALQRLKQEGKLCTLIVAGVGEDEAGLKADARDKNIEDMVQFLGFQEDVTGLLSMIDVQINASYGTEATSMALLEGMSMGIPALVSDFGGNPHVIEYRKNGLVFENKNWEDLYRHMAELVDWTVDLGELSQGAKTIFQKKFTGEVFARETEKVYMALHQKSR